jgi:hypothetical protein
MKDVIHIANPCLNAVFLYGFESPRVSAGFINAVLGLQGEDRIEEVAHLDKDFPSEDPLSEFAYHFTVDLFCKSKRGDHILIEMQNDFRDDYHLKALIEHSRMISRLDLEQTVEDQHLRIEGNVNDKRKFWKDIKGIYSLVITNKEFSPQKMKDYYPNEPLMEPNLVNIYELRHVDQLDRHYGNVPNKLALLMLAQLHDKPYEDMTPVERWAYAFNDENLRSGVKKINELKKIEAPEKLAKGDPALLEFLERIESQNLPTRVVDRFQKFVRDFNLSMADIRQKLLEAGKEEGIQAGIQEGIALGKEEGIAIGEERGREEGIAIGGNQRSFEIARKMSKAGLSLEEIMEFTGLSQEEIENLK